MKKGDIVKTRHNSNLRVEVVANFIKQDGSINKNMFLGRVLTKAHNLTLNPDNIRIFIKDAFVLQSDTTCNTSSKNYTKLIGCVNLGVKYLSQHVYFLPDTVIEVTGRTFIGHIKTLCYTFKIVEGGISRIGSYVIEDESDYYFFDGSPVHDGLSKC